MAGAPWHNKWRNRGAVRGVGSKGAGCSQPWINLTSNHGHCCMNNLSPQSERCNTQPEATRQRKQKQKKTRLVKCYEAKIKALRKFDECHCIRYYIYIYIKYPPSPQSVLQTLCGTIHGAHAWCVLWRRAVAHASLTVSAGCRRVSETTPCSNR